MIRTNSSDLADVLRSRHTPGARVAILGVGHSQRRDDACGLVVARHLAGCLEGHRVFEAGPSPENFTSAIRKSGAAEAWFVDAAILPGGSPGDVAVIFPDEIEAMRVDTHGLPLSMVMEFLKTDAGITSLAIGVHPFESGHGETLSPGMETVARAVADAMMAALETRP